MTWVFFMCNKKAAMVQPKINKKSPRKSKNQEGLLLTVLIHLIRVCQVSINYLNASAYAVGNEKMFLYRLASSFRLQRTVIWFALQLRELGSKQTKRANIRYLYIYSQLLLVHYKVFGSQTAHINNTSLVQKTRYE